MHRYKGETETNTMNICLARKGNFLNDITWLGYETFSRVAKSTNKYHFSGQ